MRKCICYSEFFSRFHICLVGCGYNNRAVALRRKSGGGEKPYYKNHCHK